MSTISPAIAGGYQSTALALIYSTGSFNLICGIAGIVWAVSARKRVQQYAAAPRRRPTRSLYSRKPRSNRDDLEAGSAANSSEGDDASAAPSKSGSLEDQDNSDAASNSSSSSVRWASNSDIGPRAPAPVILSYLIGFLVLAMVHGLWEASWQAAELLLGADPLNDTGPQQVGREAFSLTQAITEAIGFMLMMITWGVFMFVFRDAMSWCTPPALIMKWRFAAMLVVVFLAILNGLARFLSGALVPTTITIAVIAIPVVSILNLWPNVMYRRPLADASPEVVAGRVNWHPKGQVRLLLVSAMDVLVVFVAFSVALMLLPASGLVTNPTTRPFLQLAPVSAYLAHLALSSLLLVAVVHQWVHRTVPSRDDRNALAAAAAASVAAESVDRRRRTALMRRNSISSPTVAGMGTESMRRRQRTLSMDGGLGGMGSYPFNGDSYPPSDSRRSMYAGQPPPPEPYMGRRGSFRYGSLVEPGLPYMPPELPHSGPFDPRASWAPGPAMRGGPMPGMRGGPPMGRMPPQGAPMMFPQPRPDTRRSLMRQAVNSHNGFESSHEIELPAESPAIPNASDPLPRALPPR